MATRKQRLEIIIDVDKNNLSIDGHLLQLLPLPNGDGRFVVNYNSKKSKHEDECYIHLIQYTERDSIQEFLRKTGYARRIRAEPYIGEPWKQGLVLWIKKPATITIS